MPDCFVKSTVTFYRFGHEWITSCEDRMVELSVNLTEKTPSVGFRGGFVAETAFYAFNHGFGVWVAGIEA